MKVFSVLIIMINTVKLISEVKKRRALYDTFYNFSKLEKEQCWANVLQAVIPNWNKLNDEELASEGNNLSASVPLKIDR